MSKLKNPNFFTKMIKKHFGGHIMKADKPFPFFLITFLWSWLIWAPFVLAGLGLYIIDEGIGSTLSMPVFLFSPSIG